MASANTSTDPQPPILGSSPSDDNSTCSWDSPPAAEFPPPFDILAAVPQEIAEIISDQLDPLDIIRVERVSRTWRRLLRTKRVYSRAMQRASGPLNSHRDVKVDPDIDEQEYCRQIKSEIRKQFAWVEDGPILHVTVRPDDTGPGHELASFIWKSALPNVSGTDLTYSQGRLLHRRTRGSRIFSLSDLSCIELKTEAKDRPSASAGIESRYLMIATYPHFRMYDLSTLTDKYILEEPCSGDEFITGSDAFFAIARRERLIIFRPEDGSKIEEMNIFDLIDDEAIRIRVQGANLMFRGMEMAKNTLVIRIMAIDEEAVSWLFFYISGLDKCIRKCITLDPSYCNKYESGECGSDMFMTFVDTVIEASFIYTDQQCHEYATYDTVSFDLETFEHQVVEKTFALDWAPHYVGITPDLLFTFHSHCTFHSRESPDNCILDSESCCIIDAIRVYSNIAGELALVKTFSPFNEMGNETVTRLKADENWVLLISETSLDIWGFDELKCEALRPLVRGN
jgi:hypothetical protein